MPMLHVTAVALTGIYGLISLVGGAIGYLKANSVASLVAGGSAGILLLFCSFGITRWPLPSLIGATIVSLALVGRFAPKALGFAEKAAGPVDYLMSSGGVLVIVACLLAMFLASERPGG